MDNQPAPYKGRDWSSTDDMHDEPVSDTPANLDPRVQDGVQDTPADDLRSELEQSQWRWTDFRPGEDAEMDAEIKQVVDDLMQLIAQHEAKLLQGLMAVSVPVVATNLSIIGNFEAVPVSAIKALQKVTEVV